MCEIPSNVILAKAFAERFDGFSIGSNDLTQLTLGVARDSEILAELFDEQDEAGEVQIENGTSVSVGHARHHIDHHRRRWRSASWTFASSF